MTKKSRKPEIDRNAYFPWFCRSVGAIFLLEGFDPPFVCPQCGKKDAFETGDCKRIWAADLGVKL
jgi:rubrerythrin